VPLGFGHIAVRESREVSGEACVIARLCAFDELLHLECVQRPEGLSCAATLTANVKTAIAAIDSERKWTVLMTDQPLW